MRSAASPTDQPRRCGPVFPPARTPPHALKGGCVIRRFLRWLRDQWVMDELPAWRDVPDMPLLTLDQVETELADQARLPRWQRDHDLVAFLLDMRTLLGPPPAASEVLREPQPAAPGGVS